MGLDNGIMLRVKGKLEDDCPLLQLPGVGIEDGWCEEIPEDGFTCYHICYWRKCYNIRDDLFAVCHIEDDWKECGEYPMSTRDLISFREELYSILCAGPHAWDDEGGWGNGSIWTFEEAMNFLPWDIVRVSALIDYLQHEGAGRAEAYFYDSY